MLCEVEFHLHIYICHLTLAHAFFDPHLYTHYIISIYLSVCLSIYLSICLSVCLSPSLPLPASLPPSLCLSACLSACLSLSVSVCLCLSLSVSVCLCLSVCPSVCLSVSMSLYLSIWSCRTTPADIHVVVALKKVLCICTRAPALKRLRQHDILIFTYLHVHLCISFCRCTN